MVKKLGSELRIFYLDDGLIGGTTSAIMDDIRLIQSEAAVFGLRLNLNKSEFISQDHQENGLPQSTELLLVGSRDATFLGAPTGPLASVDLVLSKKIDALRVMGVRLLHFQRHDALLHFRHSFAIPKVLYLLRSSPCFSSSKLQDFDSLCVPHSQQSSTSTFPMTMHGSSYPFLSPSVALVLGVQSSLLLLCSWPQLLAALLLPGRSSNCICTVRLIQMLDSPWLIGIATICLLHPALTKANRRLGTFQKYMLAMSIWSAQVQVLYPGPDYLGLLPRNLGLG